MKESRTAVSDKVRCWTLNTFNTRGHVVCLFLYSTDSPAQSIFSTGNKAAPEIIKVSQQACLFYYYIYCSCKNCYSIAHFVISFFLLLLSQLSVQICNVIALLFFSGLWFVSVVLFLARRSGGATKAKDFWFCLFTLIRSSKLKPVFVLLAVKKVWPKCVFSR